MSSEVESVEFHGELTVPKPSMAKDANTSDAKSNAPVELDATPKKTPPKRKATPKKAAKKEKNDDEPEEPTTPKPTKKRTPKPKKEKEVKSEAKIDSEGGEPAAGEGSGATTPPAAPSSKKRGAKAKATNDKTQTPTKKRKTKAVAYGDAETPVKTKANANAKVKFPESFEEFSEGDKLLVRMRKEGTGWDEIEKAWTAVTGQIPGKDVLRKKETKLRALAIEWKAGDERKLTLFKIQVEEEAAAALKKFEEESAAALKKLVAEKWTKIAGMFKDAGSDYSSPGLQKKWELMQKKGEVDAKGNYVGDDVEAPETTAEGAEASGDAETNIEENGVVETKVEASGDVDNEDVSEGNVADNEEA